MFEHERRENVYYKDLETKKAEKLQHDRNQKANAAKRLTEVREKRRMRKQK
jgi:hypothetical protein